MRDCRPLAQRLFVSVRQDASRPDIDVAADNIEHREADGFLECQDSKVLASLSVQAS
jgi:hypothetical protein